MDRFRSKRQKVAVACDPCRARKVCQHHQLTTGDSHNPGTRSNATVVHQVREALIECTMMVRPLYADSAAVCDPCQKRSRGAACTWDTSPTKSASQVPPDRIQWLEDRIKQLEQGASLTHKTDRPNTKSPQGEVAQNAASTSTPSERAMGSFSRGISSEQPLNMASGDQGASGISGMNSQAQFAESAPSRLSKPSTQRPDISSTVDGVSPSDTRSVAIIGATTTEGQREGFFGSASAGTFVGPFPMPHAFSALPSKLANLDS